MTNLFKRPALLAALFLLAVTSASAQCASPSDPAGIACTPAGGFTFAAAKSHEHSAPVTLTGFYCGRWLLDDATNNPGNIFYGNTVCVAVGGERRWFWYDWSRDPLAGEKIAAWSIGAERWVTISYDPDCMLALEASDGQAPAPAVESEPPQTPSDAPPARRKLPRASAGEKPKVKRVRKSSARPD